ncbi:hypothetical protein KR018_005483 [Drosophila ironensis]|nr:hypothetical protein KR018_005483 [Drosophila ironensis]
METETETETEWLGAEHFFTPRCFTTNKKPNLILNVDGVIATAFVDMLRNSGSFTSEEAQEYINVGAINSLFVLGRSIGFIGHFMDQKRLKQGLYRHPWDDISYVIPEQYN